MAVYDPFRPNVVVFGDSNSYVFGPALRTWMQTELEFPADQTLIKYKSSSAPHHWLAPEHPEHVSTRGALWTRKGRFGHGPPVALGLTPSTRLVMIGLGGNASSASRLARTVPALLDQVRALAPRAAIVWRGPPPATRKKAGTWATKRQRLARFEKNQWLKDLLEPMGFGVLDDRRIPALGSSTQLYIDLMALHGRGPYAGAAIGSEEALERDQDLMRGKANLAKHADELRAGAWRSYTKARDGTNTHVPKANALDLFSEVLPTTRLFARAALLGNDPRPKAPGEILEVVDSRALIRSAPPKLRWLRPRKFEKGERVVVSERSGEHAFASSRDGRESGWTLASNLGPVPVAPILVPPRVRPPATRDESELWTVVDGRALVRGDGPDYAPNGDTLKRWSRVHVAKRKEGFAWVEDPAGQALGWTALSNLGRYHKDNRRLAKVNLQPAQPLDLPERGSARSMVKLYNRLGGLMNALATALDIEVAAAIAVWMAESSGTAHVPNKAIIRFENHLFWRRWGFKHERSYDRHFRHGGRSPLPRGAKHQFRVSETGRFTLLHGKQSREYQALALGTRLANRNLAIRSISIGGPQILISNYRLIGYSDPETMYAAFQQNERSHVLGFFDFCEGTKRDGTLVRYMREHRWAEFGKRYNGSTAYGPKIAKFYKQAKAAL